MVWYVWWVCEVVMYQLYPFQQLDYNAVVAAMKRGVRRVCYCLPTGGGKTVIFCHLCEQVAAVNRRIVFIVDRDVLVEQASRALNEGGIRHGIFQANKMSNLSAPVLVCSAQTMVRRRNWPTFDIAVIDECHVQYRKVLDRLKEMGVFVIGLTATPFAKGMGKFYDEIVSVSTTNQLIDIREPRRVLVPPLLSVGSAIASERLVVGSSGEYTAASVSDAIDAMLGDPVNEWHLQTLKHFGGPVPSLAFTNTIADGEKLEAQYQQAGFNWRQVSANDSQKVKDRKIEDLRRHRIHGLISCTMLERGFNMPELRCLQFFRKYRENFTGVLQAIGRGLRWTPGKDYCLVIDHSGNVEGYAEDIANFYDNGVSSLDMSEHKVRINEKKDKEPAKCRQCGNLLLSRRANCITCGAEIPKPVAKTLTVAARFRTIDLNNHQSVRENMVGDLAMREHAWKNICGMAYNRWGNDKERAQRYAYAQWANMVGRGVRTPDSYRPVILREIDPSVKRAVNRQYATWKKKQAVAA